MRRKITIFVLIAISLCLITSCTKSKNKVEIYSISGENENITINNGLIIVTDDTEKLIGGDLAFKNKELSNVKYYNATFFFYKEDAEITVLSNSGSIEGNTEGIRISPDMGSISSENLFYDNDLEWLKESLEYSLTGNLVTGESFEYNIAIDVKKVY